MNRNSFFLSLPTHLDDDASVVEVVDELLRGRVELEELLVVEVRVGGERDLVRLVLLLVQVDGVRAEHVGVLVGQAAAVGDLEDEVDLLAHQLVGAVYELVVLLSVLAALAVARRNLNLRRKERSREPLEKKVQKEVVVLCKFLSIHT